MSGEFENALSKVIAKSWTDPDFRARLLSSPKDTLAAEGIGVPDNLNINIVEDTDSTVHVVLPYVSSAVTELDESALEAVAAGKSRGGQRIRLPGPGGKDPRLPTGPVIEDYAAPELVRERIEGLGGKLSWDCGPSGCSRFQCGF